MKYSLTKILLTLLLVVNPLAVLASNFHSDIHLDKSTEMVACHTADQQSAFEESEQNVNTDCEMPCCQDVSCLDQSTCVIHYGSALLSQQSTRLHPNVENDNWDTAITKIPLRELPPDNPPPIHV